MNYTEQVEFVGLYDELAVYFGGEPIIAVEQNYYQNDKVGFLEWMRRTSKKLRMRSNQGATLELVGKNITTYCNI